MKCAHCVGWAVVGVLGAGLLMPAPTAAGLEDATRVRLIGLPERERVEIQLQNDHVTLVAEERIVPLVEGLNAIDFAWARQIGIDPETTVFEVIEAEDGEPLDAQLISVSHPPNENALVWHVSTDRSAAARVRISYLLDGLSNHFSYRATADPDEQFLTLRQYVRVENLADEALGESEIRLRYDDVLTRPVGARETRQMLVHRYEQVPLVKTFTVDVHEYGWLDEDDDRVRVPQHFVIHNDAAHNLGERPLPMGKVRVFQQEAGGSSAFLGEDVGKHTPRGEEMRLFLGLAQDVAVQRRITSRERTRVLEEHGHYDVVVEYEIENFRDEVTELDIVENMRALREEAGIRSDQPPAWEILPATTFEADPDPERTDQSQVVFRAQLPAREGDQAETVTHELHVRFNDEWRAPVRPLPRR